MRSLILLVALAGVARAGATINMTSVEADGLALRELTCKLDGGSLFGGMIIVGTLAKQKRAFDACAPAGETFHVELTMDGRRAHGRVTAGGKPAQRACVERAIARVQAPLDGTCSLELLAGKHAPAPAHAAADSTHASADPAAPAHASAEPAAAPAKTPPLAQLRSLLGKPADSPSVTAVLAPLSADRSVSEYGDDVYFSYKPEGLSVLMRKRTVTSLFFYASGADGFAAFAGELPGGLRFGDTRADVERKLGAPQVNGGEGVIPFWSGFAGGVSVTYRDTSTTARDNPLHHVVMVLPR